VEVAADRRLRRPIGVGTLLGALAGVALVGPAVLLAAAVGRGGARLA
jgi:hypothetical protein